MTDGTPASAARAPETKGARLATIGRGALMGLADLVPGVSGGTIALILGIYRRWVDAIRSIDARLARAVRAAITGGSQGRRAFVRHLGQMDAWFLVLLAVGILGAGLTFSRPMSALLEGYPTVMLAVFSGLILASVPIPWRLVGRRTPATWAAAAVAAIVTYVIVGLPGAEAPEGAWFIPIAGAIAICAMILPGISGAFLLLLLGMYQPIVDAAAHLDFATLTLFGSGAMVGLLAFSRVLAWLLHHQRGPTLAALTGLMVGSLRRLWPFKDGYGNGFGGGANVLPSLSSPVLLVAIFAFALGAMISITLQWLGHRRSAPVVRAGP